MLSKKQVLDTNSDPSCLCQQLEVSQLMIVIHVCIYPYFSPSVNTSLCVSAYLLIWFLTITASALTTTKDKITFVQTSAILFNQMVVAFVYEALLCTSCCCLYLNRCL